MVRVLAVATLLVTLPPVPINPPMVSAVPARSRTAPLMVVTVSLAFNAAALPIATVPLVTVRPPVKVLLPDSVSLPVPS